MASKLTDITTTYHTFVKDQVLTETQLNEFLDYFEDQDRLSRISLSGVGIVCGFEPSIEVVTIDGKLEKQIRIKQGCGVTTDGDLLQLREKGTQDPLKKINISSSVFTNYRIFEDTNADYLPFKNNGTEFKMWEAIRSEEVSNAAEEPRLTEFAGLENHVVLLYLESYEDKSNLCDELSCDSQGIHQVARLRVLIVSHTNATILLSKDELFSKHDLMSVYLQMKDLAVPRIVLNNVLIGQGNTNTATQLVDSYKLSNFASTITDLKAGLQLMANKLSASQQTDYGIGTMLTMIDSKLPAAGATPSVFFQYRYDLLKDVVDTYNELKEWFVKVATECCPTITAFPKHLMLGRLTPIETEILESRYRHKHYRSPIQLDGPSGFEVFRSVLKRLGEILKSYPTLPETTSVTGLLRPEVRITPSSFRTVLSNKAIPFYYNLTDALLRSWNFEKTRLGKHKRNLSYNKTGVDTALDLSPAIQQPLRYNLEPHSFFRIEGHQGRDYTEVLGKIDTIKKENALSFDVKALCVDLDNNFVIDPEDYECEFEDLAVLLEAWVGEQQCSISKSTALLSSYSLSQPGYNLQEETYTGPIGVVYDPPIFTANVINIEAAAVSAKSKRLAAAESMGVTLSKDEELQVAKTQAAEVNKQYYSGTASVIENLTVKEDTIGGAFLYALQNQPNGKPNDHVLAANYYADKYIEDQQIFWDPDIKIILVDNTFHLLAYLQALSNSIPVSVAGINDDIITKYGTNIDNLCSTLQKLQVTYTDANTEKLSSKNRAILGLLINQLTAICCASKQLQALLKEIDSRKDGILERLTLKKFITQHPGLEHLGGVENGGTFVLVYLRKGNNVNGAVQNVPNGTVIADFSLPYMCCSDCAPINFIVPKAPVFLHLSKDTVCLGSDIEKLIFDVEPVDGVIKADQEITGLTISGNELSINPLTFDKTKLGQVIKFTVNEQVTNCQLVVREPLVADFEVPISPVTSTLVDFKAQGDFPAGTKYEWNFGDGNVSTLDAVSHNYILPLASGGNKVDVTLKVIPPDGSCPTLVSKSFTFETLSIDINPKTFCNNDSVKYPFTIKPEGATPTITGQGVGADRTFSALGLIPGNIPVLMNGIPVLTLQVTAQPTVIMNGNILNGNLNLTSNVTDVMTYKWVFEGASGAEVHAPITDNPNPVIPLSEFPVVKPGEPITVTLYVESTCGQVKQQKVFQMPAVNISISLPQSNFCNNDSAIYNFTVLPDGASVTISGPGVDTDKRTFSPNGLPAGSAVILLNGQPAMTLTIDTLPLVSFTVSIQNDVMTLQSNLTDGIDFIWSFTMIDGTKIHADIEKVANPIIPMSEFTSVKPGDLINILLSAKNQCGEVTDKKEIIYPSEQPNLESCSVDALNDIKGMKTKLQELIATDAFQKLNTSEQVLFEQLIGQLDNIERDPTNFLNGSRNSEVTAFYQPAFNVLREMIFGNTDQEKRQLLYELYKLYVSSFYAIIQCQNEGIVINDKDITSILNGINSNMDPNNENGFWPLQLVMDQSPGLREYALSVMQFRPVGSGSRNLIKTLFDHLS